MTAQAFVYGEFAGSLGMTDRAFVCGHLSRIKGKKNSQNQQTLKTLNVAPVISTIIPPSGLSAF